MWTQGKLRGQFHSALVNIKETENGDDSRQQEPAACTHSTDRLCIQRSKKHSACRGKPQGHPGATGAVSFQEDQPSLTAITSSTGPETISDASQTVWLEHRDAGCK